MEKQCRTRGLEEHHIEVFITGTNSELADSVYKNVLADIRKECRRRLHRDGIRTSFRVRIET